VLVPGDAITRLAEPIRPADIRQSAEVVFHHVPQRASAGLGTVSSRHREKHDEEPVLVGRLSGVRTGVDGAAVLRARSAKRLSQNRLARIVDVAGGERVSGWERGVGQPRARIIPDLARALGVDPLELLSLPNGVDLRALRLVAGRTAPELAQAVNVSVHTYLRWEAGQRLPLGDTRTLASLSRQLGVPVERIAKALEASRGSGSTGDTPRLH